MHRRATLSCQATLSGQRLLDGLSRCPKHASIRRQSSAASRRRPPPNLTEEQLKNVKQITKKIIDRIARQPPDWKHTPTLRGEEKRLAASIKLDASSNRPMSMEKAAFEADQDLGEEEGEASGAPLPLGTFVETRRNQVYSHGVVLGQIVRDRRRRILVLTTSGEVWQPVREDVVFTIPDFAPLDLVIRCGAAPFPAHQNQTRARIEVLKRLKEFTRTMEEMYNVVSQKSAEVYNKFKSSDPSRWSQTTTTEVARLVFPNPDHTTRFAVHKYLMNNPLFFCAHSSYETNEVFHVRPQSHVDIIHTIRDWSRQRDGPIHAFAETSRNIIAANEEIRKLSRNEKPSYGPATHVWTETDRTILTFLQHSLRRTRTTQTDPYTLGQSFILRKIHPSGPEVNDQLVQETLVDLGILAPWQDLMVLEPTLDLDSEPEATSSAVKAREAIVQKGFASLATTKHKTPLGPEDFYPSDPLDSVRHDFGNLPVFVIDEASAEELDDGISIERIPSEPGTYWAHVHIADPASLIPPTHVFAKEASIRSESAYFIHRSWPLFPRSLMSHAEYGLSLGAVEEGRATKVLTFSVKVNSQGELVDSKVRAGIIRNIHVITYDEVDSALGNPETPCWYPFGRKIHSKPTPRTLNESQIKDLRDLSTTAERVVAKRQRERVVLFSRPIVKIKNIVQIPPERNGPIFEPTTFRGFPTFEYSVADMLDFDSGAHSMVAEMMKLACRAASRFAIERGLPMLRRGLHFGMNGSSGPPQELLDMRTPNNYVRHDLGLTKMEFVPPVEHSLEPLAHFGLGVPYGEGYARTTSPLRRYLDLVAHWQIHHALLGSAATTTSPPFDAARLLELSISVPATDKLLKILDRNHQRYWQLMIIKRFAEDTANGVERHDDPLQRLEAVTLAMPKQNEKTRKFHVESHVRLLGINATLEDLDTTDIPPGTTLPVKIQQCRLGVRPHLMVTLK
ncbi:hypothetical protein LshimejAT787_0802200 [Lyophyllum shimeji]|uniref:RNB domain-containing protein n=1 Tax=Lyophyllum shimeji TaxID=47721 RepID=A0A9P3PRS4_LYOSH|nr:hypothetical protein LshimejAT787_0802200 [Lyophyllum shimeji]